MSERLLSAPEVAQVLGCSRQTIYRMADRGLLTRIHVRPRLVRYTASDITRLTTTQNDERPAAMPSVRKEGASRPRQPRYGTMRSLLIVFGASVDLNVYAY